MSVELVQELKRQAESLSPAEKLDLGEYLVAQAQEPEPDAHPLRWSDVRGLVEYPMLGEDAQAWVSRTRAESDEARERALRR